ncbi:serine/threonine protein kinase [Parasphingorhabdus sp.]|uniref:serine/threonine protein kinase n=1 Tax=Parasphingorhabdus sp. TaxID=2709688 RepID=UPI003A91D132
MVLTYKENLGSGGFGTVDLVVDENGNEFARKTFSINQPMAPELVPNVRKRFVREARYQSGVNHRNIVPIVDHNLEGDAPFYLMPVALSTLEKDLAEDPQLNGGFRLALADIISGLEELHSLDMYHRDLKPQNVLRFLDANGDRVYYAISDFGFVSMNDSSLSKLTVTGMAKGTDYYTAPEITKDLREASAQSDIFSLGCILHDMVGIDPRVPCNEIREEGDFGALLLNCTRAKPNRRFKSVGAVRDVLVSIDPEAGAIENDQAVSLAELLDSGEDLTKSQITQAANFLEDNLDKADGIVLLRKISMNHIEQFQAENLSACKRIGLLYAEWVTEGTFDFDFCDVLVNRLNAFMADDSLELRAECLMAMLKMGTSHNRWYVERTFYGKCKENMEDGLAKRLAVEFRARGKAVCAMIQHLELSISADRSLFHPLIAKAIDETCG